MKALEWLYYFVLSFIYGDFSRRSRAADHSGPGQILQNFEPIRNFIAVLATCKYKEELITNEGARVVTRFSPL